MNSLKLDEYMYCTSFRRYKTQYSIYFSFEENTSPKLIDISVFVTSDHCLIVIKVAINFLLQKIAKPMSHEQRRYQVVTTVHI